MTKGVFPDPPTMRFPTETIGMPKSCFRVDKRLASMMIPYITESGENNTMIK